MDEQKTVKEHLRTLFERELESTVVLKKTKKNTGRSMGVEESRPNNWSLNDCIGDEITKVGKGWNMHMQICLSGVRPGRQPTMQ